MTAVWYLGAGSRTITGAQWTAAGISGSPADNAWNSSNGYSVPAASFTGPQLTILAADGGFNVAGTDGPRPGSTITPADPSQLPATQGYVKTLFPAVVQEDDILAVDSGGNFTKHGNQQLAIAKLTAAVLTSFGSSVLTQIFDCTLEVPPCKRPVTIEACAAYAQSVQTVNGGAYLSLYDVTTNTPVLIGTKGHATNLTYGVFSKSRSHDWNFDVGPSDIWRCFYLVASNYPDSGAGTHSGSIANGAAGSETIIRAVA